MPCMCGDPYCWSCGSAQGHGRCPNCGSHTADGGCADPEACARANDEADEQQYQDWLASEEAAKQYWHEEEVALAGHPDFEAGAPPSRPPETR